MKVTLKASTGAKIIVWRKEEVFHARLADASELESQACLPVDLFEVIAELANLDLEEGAQAAEAMDLAERAKLRLASVVGDDDDDEANGPGAQASGGAS
jgi:hypothetical protein